jgi:hypothetical protein
MRIPCTHQAPQECRDCSGEAAEEREYFFAEPEEQRRYRREMTGWWLSNCRRTRDPQPAPREDTA